MDEAKLPELPGQSEVRGADKALLGQATNSTFGGWRR